ncbi:DUF502 domain-containing protein [Methylosoma difficile]
MKELLKKLFNYFLIGTFAVVPIVIVLQIIFFVKGIVSDLFQIVYHFSDSYTYTALLFIISFAILVSIGNTLVKNGRSWIISSFDFVIDRIPVLSSIYRVLKKIITMFSSREQKQAKEVVYVEYPKEGVWVPAYITNRYDNWYVLFIPTSPNPTSGFTVIVDQDKVIKSDMNIEEATSFIVSVGVDFNKVEEMKNLG